MIRDRAALAACRSASPEDLFVQGAAQHRAKLICRDSGGFRAASSGAEGGDPAAVLAGRGAEPPATRR